MTASDGALSPAREGASAQRVPDFFIVGHPKCGTTALYRMLKRHPQVYMPELKEPWFLAPELRSRFTGPKLGMRPDTLEEYLLLFEAARREQRAGEASSSYLMSRTAAGHIADLQPAARIVAILREPASFLRSFHLQNLRVHIETESDLRKALALEHERREGRHIPRHSPRPPALMYSEHVQYVEQLRRYRARFPAEQVLVLIYDDFRSDNEATVRRVLRFLEVDDSLPIDVVEANPAKRVRSQRLHAAVQAVSVGRGPVSEAVKASVKAFTSRRLRHAALHGVRRRIVFAEPEPTDEQLMLELRRRCMPEVVALSEYLGRDLVTLWGYDRL
ncbi:MAG: sulfotransferase family protein [Solirubrobacterales bacterium]